MTVAQDDDVLSRARAGDPKAFESLVAPHRRVLLAHCYRLLASTADADDALQETLIRAWKYLKTFEGRSAVRSWLYSIATKVCLDALAQSKPRTLSSFDGTASSLGNEPPGEPLPDSHWIEPLHDARWSDGPLDSVESPESRCTLRQSVALAFLATIQLLPPAQRAALLLHEVAGWSAVEIAEGLELSVAAVNSSLQRARKTLDERIPTWAKAGTQAEADNKGRDELLTRYVHAWEAADPKLLSSILCSDAVMTMPPVPMWFANRDSIVRFFSGFILALPTKFRGSQLVSVNGEPAVAIYCLMPSGEYVADSLHVFNVNARDEIEHITVFRSPTAVTGCGLPATLA